MGIKSDDAILSSLAEYKAERDTPDTPEVLTGVGDVLPDPDEESETTEDDEETEDTDGEDDDAEESGTEAEESDDDEDSDDEGEGADSDDDSEQEAQADAEIARIQEAEKDAKARINTDLEAVKAERTKVDERLAKAEAIEATNANLSKRVRNAPIAFLKSQGIETHQDLLDLGAKIYKYGKSQGTDADAALKSWANGVERDGEQDSSVSEIAAELKELKEERAAEKKQATDDAETAKQQAEVDAEINSFSDSVIEECGGGNYPMAAKVIGELDGTDARENIAGLTLHMFKKNNKAPTTDQILEAIEMHERQKLKSLGIDPDEHFPRTKNEAKTSNASEKKKAPMKKKSKKKRQAKQTDEQILEKLQRHREEHQNA